MPQTALEVGLHRRGAQSLLPRNARQTHWGCQRGPMVSKRYLIPFRPPSTSYTKSTPGDLLASAGDDGNVLLWAQSDLPIHRHMAHDDGVDDKETWIVKRMCRSPTSREIYDLAWSPNGQYFITGSMDNVACVYDASSGTLGVHPLAPSKYLSCRRCRGPSDRRPQSLRSRRCVGSSQRVHRDAVIRPLGPRLRLAQS